VTRGSGRTIRGVHVALYIKSTCHAQCNTKASCIYSVQLASNNLLNPADESRSEFLSPSKLEVTRTDERPGLALKEIRLDLPQPTMMEIAGTEHEAIRWKALGRSDKTLVNSRQP